MGCRCFWGQQSWWPLSNCMCVRSVSTYDCCQRGRVDKQLTWQLSVIGKKQIKQTGWLPTLSHIFPEAAFLDSHDPEQLVLSNADSLMGLIKMLCKL